jgi:phospholipid transport system transporter-binding protein
MQFEVRVNDQDILCVTGKIYLNDIAQACAQGSALIDQLATVRVDMSGVLDSDSGCLAMMLEWLRVAKVQNKDISFNKLPQFMLDLCRVCGLDTVLPVDRVLQFHN